MRLMAFDPSLVNLGYAYGHLIDNKVVIERSGTFQPDKFLKLTGKYDTGDQSTDRSLAVDYFISLALTQFKPEAVAGETAFYNNLNPRTIMVQSKGLGVIEKVIRQYLTNSSTHHEYVPYPPNAVKMGIGLSKDEFNDKDKINFHLYRLIKEGKIVYLKDDYLPNNQLDHANDAVAMMITMACNLMEMDINN